jgi:hypothetical protein
LRIKEERKPQGENFATFKVKANVSLTCDLFRPGTWKPPGK